MRSIFLGILLSIFVSPATRAALPDGTPTELGFSSSLTSDLDSLVSAAASGKNRAVPGGVLVVVRHGQVAYRRAFGKRALLDVPVANTPSTIYDLASLTKVIATAPAVMKLVDQGAIGLQDKLVELLPETKGTGKDGITIEHLLRHRAGLPGDDDISDYIGTLDRIWSRIFAVQPDYKAGSRFVYSDLSAIYLGKILERVTGKRLDELVDSELYEPLGMTDTSFRTDGKPCERCAPTEKRAGKWMVGEVHDPRAFALGGVAGHAGLFSTADDVAVFSQMILGCGQVDGVRVLARDTVRQMTAAPPDLEPGEVRGLGWDIDTAFSSPRGSGFPIGSFGHTGYTGTSVWIDPSSDTAVVLLTNRVHPVDGSIDGLKKLRAQAASIVAEDIVRAPLPSAAGLRGFCAPARLHTDASGARGASLVVKTASARARGLRAR